ncbi:hypothetical protein BDW22DRAFT_1432555 [Trametopsis cervina]|nr:hypothetical protein BDW22DRAFT_1432555 [Trametopsis cervina]
MSETHRITRSQAGNTRLTRSATSGRAKDGAKSQQGGGYKAAEVPKRGRSKSAAPFNSDDDMPPPTVRAHSSATQPKVPDKKYQTRAHSKGKKRALDPVVEEDAMEQDEQAESEDDLESEEQDELNDDDKNDENDNDEDMYAEPEEMGVTIDTIRRDMPTFDNDNDDATNYLDHAPQHQVEEYENEGEGEDEGEIEGPPAKRPKPSTSVPTSQASNTGRSSHQRHPMSRDRSPSVSTSRPQSMRGRSPAPAGSRGHSLTRARSPAPGAWTSQKRAHAATQPTSHDRSPPSHSTSRAQSACGRSPVPVGSHEHSLTRTHSPAPGASTSQQRHRTTTQPPSRDRSPSHSTSRPQSMRGRSPAPAGSRERSVTRARSPASGARTSQKRTHAATQPPSRDRSPSHSTSRPQSMRDHSPAPAGPRGHSLTRARSPAPGARSAQKRPHSAVQSTSRERLPSQSTSRPQSTTHDQSPAGSRGHSAASSSSGKQPAAPPKPRKKSTVQAQPHEQPIASTSREHLPNLRSHSGTSARPSQHQAHGKGSSKTHPRDPSVHPPSKSSGKEVSQRVQKLHDEQPILEDSDADAGSEDSTAEHQWHHCTKLVYSSNNNLSLNLFHHRLRAVVQEVYRLINRYIYVENAYPDATPFGKDAFLYTMFKQAAEGDADISFRLTEDSEWFRRLKRMLSAT